MRYTSAVSDRAIKLSHCGSSVGTGLVRRSSRLTRSRTQLTVSSARKKEHGKGVVIARRGKKGDVSGYQRIVAYDRSLFPSIFLPTDDIPRHSPTTLLAVAFSLPLSFSISLVLPLRFRGHSPHRPRHPSPLAVSRCFLTRGNLCLLRVLCSCRSSLQSPLHSSSLGPSTRLPNTAISALSPLRHFNYEMINS